LVTYETVLHKVLKVSLFKNIIKVQLKISRKIFW